MIIKRKIYSSPPGTMTSTKSVEGPSGGVSIESGGDVKQAPNMSVSKSSAYQSLNAGSLRPELAKINMIEKSLKVGMYSDSPMGISYVGKRKKTKRDIKKENPSYIARYLNKYQDSIMNKYNRVLYESPISDNSYNRQRQRSEAVRYYLGKVTGGLNSLASKVYSDQERMPVSSSDMRKAETEGVVQRRPDGKWGIIAKKKRLWWSAGYDSRESAEAALRAYHAGRH